jgi:hypothetical protein
MSKVTVEEIVGMIETLAKSLEFSRSVGAEATIAKLEKEIYILSLALKRLYAENLFRLDKRS